MKKVKTYSVQYGGESIISDHLGDTLEQLLGVNSLEKIEVKEGEELDDIIITIKCIYTEKDLDKMPEYQ